MEYGIICPHLDNDGNSLVKQLANFEDLLLEHCGGFTAHDVRGAWRGDDGEIYRDVSTLYTINTSQDYAEHLAMLFLQDARQEAVYVRLPGGKVEILRDVQG